MSVLGYGALEDINAHLGLILLVPEATLRFLDNLNVPADKLVELGLEVSEVLRVLRNQVSIVRMVIEGRLTPFFMLLNLLKELRRRFNPVVLAHAEPLEVDHWSWVDLLK